MRKLLFTVSLLLIFSSTAMGGDSVEDNCKDTISFSTAEVFVDSNKDDLVAYQIGIRYDKNWRVEWMGSKNLPFMTGPALKGGILS